jgi:hypothetical protein
VSRRRAGAEVPRPHERPCEDQDRLFGDREAEIAEGDHNGDGPVAPLGDEGREIDQRALMMARGTRRAETVRASANPSPSRPTLEVNTRFAKVAF